MANTLRIKRRTIGTDNNGVPTVSQCVNAELAFNEVTGILYYGKGGNTTASDSVIAIGSEMTTGIAAFLKSPTSANLATAITNETGTAGSLVFSASPSFTGTVQTSGDIYANTSTATSGKLVATTDYVDSAVSRTTGAGMSLHPVAADCATTGPLTLVSYYDSLAPLLSAGVKVAIPQPASAAEGAALYELKGLPIVQTVQLVAGDKVLVMGHLDPSMIGLWVIPAGAGANTYWTRETGYETAQGFHFGARVAVTSGTYTGQIFAVLADAVYPTKDVAGPNFNSVNFATTSSSVPSGAGVLFDKVVRAKADTYSIVNGKVVVDGVTLNQSDRFLWTPTTANDVTSGGLTGGTYTNVRAGIWRVNYDKVTGGNAFNVITRAGDLNDQADFVNFHTKKILVREGATNANRIFTAVTNASTFTVAQEITDTAGSTATFAVFTAFSATASSGLTGTPVIDGYQTVVENLAASPAVIGSVVLVKNEVTPITNGLYYIKATGWIRHPSADAAGELFYGSYIRVNNGTVNKNSGFVLTTNLETITPGSDALSFESPTALLDFRAGIGLERVGREFRVKAASANITVGSSGIDVASGTTSAAGIVQLEDSTSSTSTVKAATPNSVKSAYDLANTANTAAGAAQTTANAALPKAGGTMTGTIILRAGTAASATAPIYLTSGTNLTTAASGAVEWNGTNLFITDSAVARKTVAFTDSNITGTAGGLNYTSTATAATTTTLTNASTYLQYFTGSTTQTVVLPVNTTLASTSRQFEIHNNSTGLLTVNSSGSNAVVTVAAGINVKLTCTNTASADATAAAWVVEFNGATTNTGSGKLVYATSPDFTTSITTASTTIGVFDTTATTVNAFGGASTALNMGHASGTTLIRGDLTLGAAASGKKLRLNGATSGTVDIQATTAAGTNTATFPAATGTVILDTAAGLSSSTLRSMLSDETGTGVAVFATSPVFTTGVSLPAGQSAGTFNVFNEVVGNLNAFTLATNVNIGSETSNTGSTVINLFNNLPGAGQTRAINLATTGNVAASPTNITIGTTPANGVTTTTLNGTVVVAGNLTVNGATTILNTSTLTVDDRNIEIGSVVTASGLTGTVGSVVGNTATITGLASTGGLAPGMTVTRTSGAGALGTGATISTVDSLTAISISASSAPTAGAVTFDVGGATDVTAAGGGITLKGGGDKTIIWNDATKGWEFNQNVTTSGTTVNVNGTNPVIATSQTTGTASVFNTNVPTVNIAGVANDVGIATSATGAGTIAIGTGALASGIRAINIGHAVAAGTVNVNIGAAASGTTTINSPTVGIGQSGSGITTINSPTIALNGGTISTNVTSGTLALFNTGLTGTLNIGGASTTVTLGGTSTTSLTLGSSNASSTTNIATGAHATGVTKAVNVGTAGALGSTTNVNIGSGTAGATTSVSVGGDHTSGGVTINPTSTSTTTATGALIVKGGVGIAENLNVGGSVTIATGKALNSSAAIVSAAGNNFATATALTNDINIVTVNPSGGGVILPTPTLGRVVVVTNRVANELKVYPNGASSINGTGGNAPITVAGNATVIVRAGSTTQWFSELTDLTNSATGTLPVGNGGTGAATFTSNGLIYGNGTNALGVTAAGSQYQVLRAGSGGTPAFGSINLDQTSAVTGTLPVGNGGTGVATLTGLVKGNGTANFAAATAGTDYLAPPTGTALLKANSGGALANATAGTDYVVAGTATVGGLLLSTTTTITAAGTTQADATVLTNDINVVTTTAVSTGVKLPTPAAGRVIAVVNRGANTLKVYPATSTAINTLANNVAFSVAANATLTLRGSSAAQWYAELTAESPCSLVADCTLDGGTF